MATFRAAFDLIRQAYCRPVTLAVPKLAAGASLEDRHRNLLKMKLELEQRERYARMRVMECLAYIRSLERKIRHWEVTTRQKCLKIKDQAGVTLHIPSQKCQGPCGRKLPLWAFPIFPTKKRNWSIHTYCSVCERQRWLRMKKHARDEKRAIYQETMSR